MNNTRFAIGAFLIAFIFIGIMTFIQAGPGISEDNDEEKRTIDVSGSATLTANPDKAEIYLSVTKQELSAKEAQAFVTEKMNAVRKSLIAAGVSSSDIETTDYSIYPVYDYKEGESILRGYKATHSIKVTTRDTENVGELVDVAIDSGANQVSSIQFGLTDAKVDELKLRAYKEAGISAKKKAQAIADGLDIQLGEVLAVSDSSPVVFPYYSKSYPLAAGFAAESTQIDAGPVKVSVNLNVKFEIK